MITTDQLQTVRRMLTTYAGIMAVRAGALRVAEDAREMRQEVQDARDLATLLVPIISGAGDLPVIFVDEKCNIEAQLMAAEIKSWHQVQRDAFFSHFQYALRATAADGTDAQWALDMLTAARITVTVGEIVK